MTASYEQDYGLWAEQMANLLASGRFSELDIENLVEEVRDLSKRERDRLLSSLRLILQALVQSNCQAKTLTGQGLNREYAVEEVLPKLAPFEEYQEQQQELVES